MVRYHATPNGPRQFTAEEEAEWDAKETAWKAKSAERKLNTIKQLRLQRLQATDWMSLGDVTMPDYIKTWRQSLRDIPTNYTTESKYDELLEKENGALKHSIWKQPTE
jgi:C-terminal processing protease CtpA/Prc